MILKTLAGAACATCLAVSANAALLTHSASDFTGTLNQDSVGTFFIDEGADYTFGNNEQVFNDPPFAICGAEPTCDLLTDVDARVVTPGTVAQGFASYVMVEAGFASDGSLTLTAYDIAMAVIGTALNGPPAGPNGRTTMTIDRGGMYDIAYYSISGTDSYGVNYVELDVVGATVPIPAALPLLAGGLAVLTALGRRRPA